MQPRAPSRRFTLDRMTARPATLLTVFGATGDLARRMLLPSLYRLHADGLLPPRLRILGSARSELDEDGFRAHVRAAVAEHVPAVERGILALDGLLARLDYRAAAR
jgi:glucose-6-phosphate 1-dehydrogenase